MKLVYFIIGALLITVLLNYKCLEGFSYNSCRQKGFSKEFCVTTPIAAYSTGTCLCDNGLIGLQMPGFMGECVCGQNLL